MKVSLQFLQRFSAQTGYMVPPLEKVIRLGEMAGDVAFHPFLGSVLDGTQPLLRSAETLVHRSGL